MKTHRFLALLAIAGVVLLAGSARAAVPANAAPSILDADQQTEKFSKTVPLAKGGAFDLSNISGTIVITGGSGDQVVIDAVKRGRSAEELKEVTIEVATTANRVDVRTRYPEGRGIRVWVDYTVTVPKSAAINVKSISGDEKISGLDGEIHVNSISGNVSVASATDVRAVKSVSGDVHVQASKSTAALSVSSVSGNVKLNDVTASEIQVNSVSGDVTCEAITTTRVAVKTVSGGVTFGGSLAKGGRYELASHSGDVTIFASDKIGIEVSASTFSGEVTSDLALKLKAGGDAAPGRGRRMRQSMQGIFGDGSAMLQLTSFSGNIRIVKK
ncbi:MAG: DUF4097 family beta strand repeat-containing protein [Acidobacteria bacterium]|nr:DUF4097 family beta strand repeat-containing protein [Acidobacteriota bacterium]